MHLVMTKWTRYRIWEKSVKSTVSVILLQCYRLTAPTREYRKRAKKWDVCDTPVSRFTSTWEHRSEREDWEKERPGRAARDREGRERQHVRPTSVESDETLLDSAPGISRGNGGLILRRKFLTSRTFERAGEKRLKYYPRDGFPMPEVGAARGGRISKRECALDIDQLIQQE